jgi:succinyl-CoA synthetase alpha subunit
MIGAIGGSAEEIAAEFISTRMSKPVVAFIAGQNAPAGKRRRGLHEAARSAPAAPTVEQSVEKIHALDAKLPAESFAASAMPGAGHTRWPRRGSSGAARTACAA